MTSDRDPIAYWNEDAGPRWVRHAADIDVQLEPFLEPVVQAAGTSKDARVLDVGCGAGALTLFAADRTGPGGHVIGVDVYEGILDVARARAAERRGVEFVRADAQVEPFDPGSFDCVVSRFGVMFFRDSVAAFRNLLAALRPGGKIAFACWTSPQGNPWMGIPREVVARHIDMPEAPDPEAPGPFRFADPAVIRELCEAAGFASVTVDALEGTLILGGHGELDDAVDFLMTVGPAAQAQDETDEVRTAVRHDLRSALRPYRKDGGVEMRYRAWLVSAIRGV